MVEVKNLKKRYDNKQAVDGISFTVKKGEIFGILGPNGAGKTTTLEMIETLRSIDEGTVIIDGIDVAKNPQAIKYLIGQLPYILYQCSWLSLERAWLRFLYPPCEV